MCANAERKCYYYFFVLQLVQNQVYFLIVTKILYSVVFEWNTTMNEHLIKLCQPN